MSQKESFNKLLELVMGCTFDDFIFRPQFSILDTRNPKKINLKGFLTKNIALNRPIVSANMDTVTRADMAILMAEEGGIGIIDRGFRSGEVEAQVKEVTKVKRAQHGIIKDPYLTSPNVTLGEAKRIMRDKKIGSLLVVDNEQRLIGIITRRDIRFCNYQTVSVSDRMIPFEELVANYGTTSLDNAKEKMRKSRIKQLPLIDQERKIIGLITSRDIIKAQKLPFATIDTEGRLMVGAAIGAKGDYLERAEELIKAGVDVIVIDIAHGHSVVMENAVEDFRNKFGDFELIAGNVGTADGARFLRDMGVDGIKVGIGPGGGCTTRLTTNFGVPQAQAIAECRQAIGEEVPLIADGGIKRDGQLIQAFVFGAESVMMGSVFAGTEETPGEIIHRSIEGYSEKIPFKVFRGMASLSAMKDRLDIEGADILETGAEGAEFSVPLKGSAVIVFEDMIKHLCSSISYGGAESLSCLREEFLKNPEKYLIKQSEAAKKESYHRPHY